MNLIFRPIPLALYAMTSLTMPSLTLAAATLETLESVTILGDSEDVKTFPGSGAVVSTALEEDVITDVNQALRAVPGIYIKQEDGEGLRPNIGIRGATSERSEKITLLEDGILAAPAPYSNPAAYYFPTIQRMSAIEIIKGAPLLRYGPQTTGGVVNLVSTPIPETSGGSVTSLFNDRGDQDLHAVYGQRLQDGDDQYLWQIETVQSDYAGFKDVDRSDGGTGHDLQDYVVKFGWSNDRQSLLFKGQYSEEISDETYLGLTDVDFAANPNRRYGLSVIDQMRNKHDGLSITHTFNWTTDLRQTTVAYHNTFARDWFKLSGGGSIVEAANGGDASAQAILDGTDDTTGLNYTHNNRAYVSEGVGSRLNLLAGAHELELGFRVHQDEMDRFQPIEVYDQVNGSLVFQSEIDPVGENNRLEEAEALTVWLADDWQATEKLNTQMVLRFEDVASSRVEYSDPDRATVDATRSNSSSEILPGASFTYDLQDNLQVLAGVHKGFSPLGGGATAEEEAETSVNYEAGVRYNQDDQTLEAIGFYSDFSNKAENCSLAAPCSNGDTSGRFVTGEAQIMGLELQAQKLFAFDNFVLPVSLAYTHTQAEITSSDNGFSEGDTLKDIPENVLSIRTGIETASGWNTYLTAAYADAVCSVTGCETNGDRFDETQSLATVDLASHIPVNENVQFIVKADNIFDTQNIVSRAPDGARPNKPMTLSAGVKVAF